MFYLKDKHFFILTLSGILLVILISFELHALDITTTQNDVIRQHQLKKIVYNSDIDTIFIGDSSLGNAINADYFDSIAGTHSYNLALTGSFGIEGSLVMLNRAVAQFPNLKNIVLIHTQTIWSRDFSYIGVFDLIDSFHTLSIFQPYLNDNIKLKYIHYITNPKEILWNIKAYIAASGNHLTKVENDFLAQAEEKYSNQKKKVHKNLRIPTIPKDAVKKDMFSLFNNICKEKRLNCFFLNGPIHEEVYQNSLFATKQITSFIKHNSHFIHISDKVFTYPQSMIGDNADHITPMFKSKATENYYHELIQINFPSPHREH